MATIVRDSWTGTLGRGNVCLNDDWDEESGETKPAGFNIVHFLATDEEKLVRAARWIARNRNNPDCMAAAEIMMEVVSS